MTYLVGRFETPYQKYCVGHDSHKESKECSDNIKAVMWSQYTFEILFVNVFLVSFICAIMYKTFESFKTEKDFLMNKNKIQLILEYLHFKDTWAADEKDYFDVTVIFQRSK